MAVGGTEVAGMADGMGMVIDTGTDTAIALMAIAVIAEI
jgi:hypothetical protein